MGGRSGHPLILAAATGSAVWGITPRFKARQEFAKIITAACVRRGYLEKLHEGISRVTTTGDYSDVRVIDAIGWVILW
jgi:hypothetical protein